MGSATRYRQRFLKANPYCVFCGGSADATSIEHCPPRALFQNRKWPEGFEFPSCHACNHGTTDHDLLIAMLGRSDPLGSTGNKDGALEGLMYKVNRQYPGMLRKMHMSANDARRENRILGVTPPPGKTHQQSGFANVTVEHHHAVCVLASKLAKGIFYREVNAIFPNDGCLLLNWFTNADLVQNGSYIVFDMLKTLNGNVPPLTRSGQYLNDQFEYKLTLSPNKEIMVLQARFGTSFGFVVFGKCVSGVLEATVTKLREQFDGKMPFEVLQSQILK